MIDFVVECTIPAEVELEQNETGTLPSRPNLPEESVDLSKGFWTLYMDGSSNSTEAGVGLVLVSPEGVIIEYALRFEFSAINNGAKYEALIVRLKIIRKLKVD